jgi:hypothetical protein
MRRGVEPHAPARLAQRGGNEGAHASFSVGAADVNRGHHLMGVAQRLEQGSRGGQPEFDGGGAGEEKLKSLVVAERHQVPIESLRLAEGHRPGMTAPHPREHGWGVRAANIGLSSLRRDRRADAVPACGETGGPSCPEARRGAPRHRSARAPAETPPSGTPPGDPDRSSV